MIEELAFETGFTEKWLHPVPRADFQEAMKNTKTSPVQRLLVCSRVDSQIIAMSRFLCIQLVIWCLLVSKSTRRTCDASRFKYYTRATSVLISPIQKDDSRTDQGSRGLRQWSSKLISLSLWLKSQKITQSSWRPSVLSGKNILKQSKSTRW